MQSEYTQKNKYCSECNSYLPITNFKKLTTKKALKSSEDGYSWICTECFKNKTFVYSEQTAPNNRKARRRDKRARRVASVVYTYGITEAQYIELISQQNNLCAICGTRQENKILCIDHDHNTGKVRGLLCGNCNIGLGNFKDNPKILESAIGYLKSSSQVEQT